jgi:hypothetical protein
MGGQVEGLEKGHIMLMSKYVFFSIFKINKTDYRVIYMTDYQNQPN